LIDKLILTFFTGGIVLNILYIVAVLNNGLISKNPWYFFLGGIFMLVAAIVLRNRKH